MSFPKHHPCKGIWRLCLIDRWVRVQISYSASIDTLGKGGPLLLLDTVGIQLHT